MFNLILVLGIILSLVGASGLIQYLPTAIESLLFKDALVASGFIVMFITGSSMLFLTIAISFMNAYYREG